jgi:ankyrin repeat protein
MKHPRVNPSDDDNNSIVCASMNGHIHVVEELLKDPRVDPGYDGNWALRKSIKKGNVMMVNLLLNDKRIVPDIETMKDVIENDCVEVMREMLKNKKVNLKGVLQLAVIKERLEIIKLLLDDPRVDPSDNSDTCIQYASESGNFEIVWLLLSDPRVNPGANNNYAIKCANKNGHTKIVDLLSSDPRVDYF